MRLRNLWAAGISFVVCFSFFAQALQYHSIGSLRLGRFDLVNNIGNLDLFINFVSGAALIVMFSGSISTEKIWRRIFWFHLGLLFAVLVCELVGFHNVGDIMDIPAAFVASAIGLVVTFLLRPAENDFLRRFLQFVVLPWLISLIFSFFLPVNLIPFFLSWKVHGTGLL